MIDKVDRRNRGDRILADAAAKSAMVTMIDRGQSHSATVYGSAW